jgi:hypothetical protein
MDPARGRWVWIRNPDPGVGKDTSVAVGPVRPVWFREIMSPETQDTRTAGVFRIGLAVLARVLQPPTMQDSSVYLF